MSRSLSCLAGLLLLTSCYDSNSSNNSQAANTDCPDRRGYNFEKFTSASDEQFQEFLAPMDSIDSLIDAEQIISQDIHSDFDTKMAWKKNGAILKIITESHANEAFEGTSYYRLDDCYWMHARYTYPNDTLIPATRHFYLFKDSVALNSFVTTSNENFELMTNLDSNKVNLGLCKTYYKRYTDFLNLFE